MAERAKTKAQAERTVARTLLPEIKPHLAALGRADRLIGAVLAARHGLPTNNKAPVVCAILLARLSNDLRSCGLLARKGYVLQSWTVGASALETAYSIGFVGMDEDRAKRWLAHSDSAKPAWPAFDALLGTLKTFGLESNQENFFKCYRQLSVAKHGNPLLQARFGVSRSATATRIQIDPYFSGAVARLGRLGIAWTLHGTGLGVWSFVHHYSVPDRVNSRVADFAESTRRLLDAAQKRQSGPAS